MKSIEHNTPILLTNVKKNMAQRLSLNALQGNVSCPENEYLLMIAYLYQTSNRESCVSWLRKDDEHIFTYIAQPDKYRKRRDKKDVGLLISSLGIWRDRTVKISYDPRQSAGALTLSLSQ